MNFKTLDINIVNGMYDILIENLNDMSADFNENDDDYENWKNYCTDNKVIVLHDNQKVYAFLMYKDNNILEIQIDKAHQGDKTTLRSLIKKYLENIESSDITSICCSIYPYHKKALEMFTSIGFVNTEKNCYEIDIEMFKDWAYRR